MKKKLSLTEKISLAENNAVDFMHACVTIALHDEYEVGVQRLRKVNLRRDEINEEMLEVPRKSGREQAAAGQAWLVSLLPEGAETEFRVPLGKGAARKQKELQIRMAVDNAATLEWRVYAAACAEVLGFGAKRLNDLHKAVTENFRQLSEWAIEDGVDVALERFCRCARDAYKTDVQVEDIPDAQALHQQQRQTRQALDGLAERAWMVEASRRPRRKWKSASRPCCRPRPCRRAGRGGGRDDPERSDGLPGRERRHPGGEDRHPGRGDHQVDAACRAAAGAVGTAAAAGRGAGRRGAGDGGRCGSGAVRERRQRMSKDKCRMSRKRFCKKAAGKWDVQVQEARDIVREERVNPLKRRQEKIATAKHRAGKQEGKAV